jgi:actin related protein 2/3 complex subunit 5
LTKFKENAVNLTLRVLLSIKPSQIEEAVNSLSPDLIDVLMKYIYRGFEYPSEGSSGHLLIWHEKVFNVGGVGCIVRVLSDTRRA